MGDGRLAIVVGESNGVVARVVQLDVSVALGQDVDGSRRFLIFGKEVLKVGEVVRLNCVLQVSNGTET